MEVYHNDKPEHAGENGIESVAFVAAHATAKVIGDPLIKAHKHNTNDENDDPDNE